MTRTVGTFGKHLEYPAGKCRGFLRFQHHSAFLQRTVNISCTSFLFFGVIKDFVDTVLSGTEPFDFRLRFALVNCNRNFPSSLTGCSLYPKLFIEGFEHSFFYAQEFDSSKARIINEI